MTLDIELYHHINELPFKIYSNRNILICNISQGYCAFYYISDQINAALVSIIDIFKTHLNIVMKLLTGNF